MSTLAKQLLGTQTDDRDGPTILLVHNEKYARNVLRELGIETSQWRSGIHELLRPQVYSLTYVGFTLIRACRPLQIRDQNQISKLLAPIQTMNSEDGDPAIGLNHQFAEDTPPPLTVSQDSLDGHRPYQIHTPELWCTSLMSRLCFGP